MTQIADGLLEHVRRYLSLLGQQTAEFVAPWPDTLSVRELDLAPLACLRHLPACSGIASDARAQPMVQRLIEGGRSLHWGQTYSAEDFGQAFIDNYGWVELVGTRGHFRHDRVACGFLVLGPGVHYPDHHHEAEEIYVPLTDGTLWSKGGGGFVERKAGEVIHHPSNISHAMKTGDKPLLALYLWRGGPLAARSTVTGAAE